MKSSAAVLLLCLVASATLGRASIVSVAQSQPSLSTLVAAVQAAGLVEALSNPEEPLTVFAPTDDAFAATLQALGMTADELLADTELLTTVLSYHVVPGVAAMAADLSDSQVLPTLLDGQNITVSLTGGEVLLLSPGAEAVRVITPDVAAGDSVGSIVHIIDGVLIPEM